MALWAEFFFLNTTVTLRNWSALAYQVVLAEKIEPFQKLYDSGVINGVGNIDWNDVFI